VVVCFFGLLQTTAQQARAIREPVLCRRIHPPRHGIPCGMVATTQRLPQPGRSAHDRHRALRVVDPGGPQPLCAVRPIPPHSAAVVPPATLQGRDYQTC
jgi:hypothetical protein